MKRKTRKWFRLIFFLVVIAISGNVYFAYSKDVAMYNLQIEDLDRQLAKQKKIGAELDGTGDIYSSQENVEKIARETLGMVKTGERFFKNYNDNQ